jgi:hypothetical protein
VTGNWSAEMKTQPCSLRVCFIDIVKNLGRLKANRQ